MLHSIDSLNPFQGLAALGPDRSSLAMLSALTTGSFHDRWEAVKQIPSLGDDVLGDLCRLVQNPDLDWEIRWFATRSLAHFDRPEAITTLIDLVCTTDDDDLLQASTEALTAIGPAAIVALTQLVAESGHREEAIRALAQIRHPDTLAPLLAAIGHTQGAIKATVLEALSQFDDPSVLPWIIQSLQDPAAVVRLAAIRGLVGWQRQLAPQQWVTQLSPHLWDVNLSVAQQAVYALGRSPLPVATDEILRVLQADSTPAPLQFAAAHALGWQGTAQALEALIVAWDGAAAGVRLAIVQGLSRLTLPELKPQIAQQLGLWLTTLPATLGNSALRRNLVVSLGHLGGAEAMPHLQELLQDSDEGVRLHAEAALRELGSAADGASHFRHP